MSLGDPPSYDAVLEASQAPYTRTDKAADAMCDTRVTVTDPVLQRGASGGQYTSFKVTTHSTNPKYKCCNAGNAVVMRRFREFHMLFRKLRSDFPGTVVPPCPEKNPVQKLRKDADFIEARRQALEVFINKLCCHRILRHSDLLRTFLEADEPAWQMEMHRMKQSEEQGTMLGTVTQLASDLMHSTKNLTKGQSDDKGEEPEYLQYKEYSTLLEHHLKDACSRSVDFVAKQQAYGEALEKFGTQASNMSKYEESTAASAFADLHATATTVAKLHADVSLHVGRIFAAPMKEQHLAIKSCKDTQHDRSVALAHKTQAESAVKAAKGRLAQLRSSGKPEAVLQAETKLADAEQAERKAAEEYEKIQSTMREELVVFQSERSEDMTRALRDFALAQAKLAKQSAKQWKDLVDKMKHVVDGQNADTSNGMAPPV